MSVMLHIRHRNGIGGGLTSNRHEYFMISGYYQGSSTARLPHFKPPWGVLLIRSLDRSRLHGADRPSPGSVRVRPVGMVMSACEDPHFPLLRSPLSTITSVNGRAQVRTDHRELLPILMDSQMSLTDTVPPSLLDHHNDTPILGVCIGRVMRSDLAIIGAM